MTWLSVDLPEPFGPMMAWTWPLFTVSDSPWRISRSSTRTCRSLTSSNDIVFFRLFLMPEQHRRRISRDEALSHAAFERYRDQIPRLDLYTHPQLEAHPNSRYCS